MRLNGQEMTKWLFHRLRTKYILHICILGGFCCTPSLHVKHAHTAICEAPIYASPYIQIYVSRILIISSQYATHDLHISRPRRDVAGGQWTRVVLRTILLFTASIYAYRQLFSSHTHTWDLWTMREASRRAKLDLLVSMAANAKFANAVIIIYEYIHKSWFNLLTASPMWSEVYLLCP